MADLEILLQSLTTAGHSPVASGRHTYRLQPNRRRRSGAWAASRSHVWLWDEDGHERLAQAKTNLAAWLRIRGQIPPALISPWVTLQLSVRPTSLDGIATLDTKKWDRLELRLMKRNRGLFLSHFLSAEVQETQARERQESSARTQWHVSNLAAPLPAWSEGDPSLREASISGAILELHRAGQMAQLVPMRVVTGYRRTDDRLTIYIDDPGAPNVDDPNSPFFKPPFKAKILVHLVGDGGRKFVEVLAGQAQQLPPDT